MTSYDTIIPDTASGEEAAVIAAAISIHLQAEERAALINAGDESTSWTGKRWAFANRLEQQHLTGGRVPLSAPNDAWTAVGRRDRY